MQVVSGSPDPGCRCPTLLSFSRALCAVLSYSNPW